MKLKRERIIQDLMSLNNGDHDHMINDHLISIFDENSQKSDDNYMIENDSPPIFDDYYNKSEEFNMSKNESSLLFEDYHLEDDYDKIDMIEEFTPSQDDDYSLEDDL